MRHGVDPLSDPRLMSQKSHPGDGKLDVLTLRHAARVITGSLVGGRRVFHGAPLYFNFHEYDDDDTLAYLNVDGEFYKVRNPTSLCIVHGGTLQVLHSKKSMANSHEVDPS